MNEHIETYCKNFIDNKNNPEFALFIKGPWGCGKTFFVRNLVKKYYKSREKEFAFISLFGIKEVSELDMKIFQSVYPKANMIMDIGLKVGLPSIGFGLDDSVKETLVKSLNGKTANKKVFIVDDLERAELTCPQIFGYFSEFIISYGTKIIFIGNEDKIDDYEYQKIKEKIIGIEFLIEPDDKNAINYFIEELKINITEKNLNDIKEIIEMLQCKNLRLIRQSFYNLSLFLQDIEKSLNSEHLETTIRIFFALFMQKSLNLIGEKEHVEDAISAYRDHRLDYKTYKNKKEEKDDPDYVNDCSTHIPFMKCWETIIFDGNYSGEFILAEYNKEMQEIMERENKKTLYHLKENWYQMNSNEFKNKIEKVIEEFNNGYYLHMGDILHYYNFMTDRFADGLIDYDTDKLNTDIDNLIKNYSEKIKKLKDEDIDSYAGFSFRHWPEDIVEKLRNVIKIHETESIKQEFAKEIQNLPNNYSEFIEYIKRHHFKAILSLIDIQILFDKMQSLSLSEQNNIVYSLEEMYGMRLFGEKISGGKVDRKYFSDFENLEKLHKLYENSQGDILYNPEEYQKRQLTLTLKKLVEYFRNSMERQI